MKRVIIINIICVPIRLAVSNTYYTIALILI